MRTATVYLLALAALVTALVLGFPEWFQDPEAPAQAATRPKAAPPIVVALATRRPMAHTREALGTVRANESVEITPTQADHVSALHFDDGQQVEKGQLLVEMHAKEEKAQLEEAVAARDDRRLAHARAKELHDQNLLSVGEYETARLLLQAAQARVLRLQAAIADRRIHAPFSGVLGLRRVSVGAFVQPSTVITTLDDLSVVKLDFTIPETWLPYVRPGQEITARSDIWPDLSFEGRIATTDTRLDARTRSATVRALLQNPDTKLRPGMLLRVGIHRAAVDVLQIPEEALIPRKSRHYVFRIDDGDVARRVEVEVGLRIPGAVEIRKGLSEGDRIAIEGLTRIDDGTRVRIAETRKARD